jgi:hypothetical protein
MNWEKITVKRSYIYMFLVIFMQMIDLCDEKLNLRRSINELKVS